MNRPLHSDDPSKMLARADRLIACTMDARRKRRQAVAQMLSGKLAAD
jgi:hypothetical protein